MTDDSKQEKPSDRAQAVLNTVKLSEQLICIALIEEEEENFF